MAKPRKNAPALYELIRERSRLAPPGPHPPHEEPVYEEEPHHEEEPHRSLLSPGRTVRIPVGYFFFALAIVIAVGIGGYMLGYLQRQAMTEREERRQAQLEAPTEPLDRPINRDILAGTSARTGSPASGSSLDPSAGPGARPRASGGDGRLVVVGPGTPDPRERGVNYAIVASLGRDRALDVANFLSARGVDVAVVKPNNVRLHSVVALRGFPSGTFRTEERRRFEASLKELGREYAAQGGGRKDFSELWWDRFDG